VKYYWIVFSIFLLLLSNCRIHGVASELPGFSDNDEPKPDEGIAVFSFKSANKHYLPSQVTFTPEGKATDEMHFALSGWTYKKTTQRYVFLKQGTYQFTRIRYRSQQDVQEFSFPTNSFRIKPRRINYIGDFVFVYSRTFRKPYFRVYTQNNMNRSMLDFYKEYKKIPVRFPLINSYIKMNTTSSSW